MVNSAFHVLDQKESYEMVLRMPATGKGIWSFMAIKDMERLRQAAADTKCSVGFVVDGHSICFDENGITDLMTGQKLEDLPHAGEPEQYIRFDFISNLPSGELGHFWKRYEELQAS